MSDEAVEELEEIPEEFVASVQYGDWKGTVAADNEDDTDLDDWLEKRVQRRPDEMLIGVSVFVSSADEEKPFYVSFFLSNSPPNLQYWTKPVPVRVLGARISSTEFFKLFKRFELKISRNGMLTERKLISAKIK